MIDVRIARKTDARGIAEVHVLAWQQTYPGIFPVQFLDSLSVAERERQWEVTIQNVNAFSTDKMVMVAEDSRTRRIVGFIHVGSMREGDGRHDSEVYALYVLQEFHHRGVGRSLIFHGLEWLQAKSYLRTKLWVVERNPSRAFYARMGATLTRDVREVRIGGVEVTKIAYTFDLERWGKAKDLWRMRWIVILSCLPSGAIAEGVAHLLGFRDHVHGFRTELYDILHTTPTMLVLPILWLALTHLASPKSALGVDSYQYWRQGGYATITMTYLSQFLMRSSLVSELSHQDMMAYFYPGLLALAWVILALYAYLIRLLFRRSMYE